MKYVNDDKPYAVPESPKDCQDLLSELGTFTFTGAGFHKDFAHSYNGIHRLFERFEDAPEEVKDFLFNEEQQNE